MTVFGAVGMGVFGLPLLICWVMWLVSEFEGGEFAITVAAFTPFFLASIILFGRGLYLYMRSSRFRKYMRRIGSKTVCSIERSEERRVGKESGYRWEAGRCKKIRLDDKVG